MKRLIFVRHGDYNNDGRLTEAGRDKVRVLAEMLVPVTGDGDILILSSTAPRAADSAKVIWDVLQVARLEHCEVLWDDDNHYHKHDDALKLVQNRADEANTIIVVGHLPHRSLLCQYAAAEFGIELRRPDETGKGQGQLLNCVEKSLTAIRPY